MLMLLNNGWGMRHVGLRIEMHRVCLGEGRGIVGKRPIEIEVGGRITLKWILVK